MPILYGLVLACSRMSSGKEAGQKLSTTVRLELSAAACMILFAMGVVLISNSVGSGSEMLIRGAGLFIAVGLILVGNGQPKQVVAITEGPASVQNNRFNRFSGFALFIAGIATLFAWVALPLEHSNSVAMTASFVCLASVAMYRFANGWSDISEAHSRAARRIWLEEVAN